MLLTRSSIIARRMLPLLRRYASADATAAKTDKKAAVPVTSEELRLTLAAPYKVIFSDTVVKQVDVNTLNGAIGILPKHVPVLGMLKPGIVRVIDIDGKDTKYFASSGTVAMNSDGSCQVLAEELAELEDIDVAKAEEELRSAQRRIQEATNETDKMAVQIEITTYEALIRAARDLDK